MGEPLARPGPLEENFGTICRLPKICAKRKLR